MSLMILAIVLFVLGIGLILSANIITYRVIEEVNARMEPDKQFSLVFVQRKWPEILEHYRQVSPDSKMPQRITILGISGIVLLFVAFILLVVPNISFHSRAL